MGTLKQWNFGWTGLFPGFLIVMLTIASLITPLRSDGVWTEWRGDPLHLAEVTGELPPVGELIWSYQTGDQVLSSSVFYDGGMLIGSDDGNIYCMELDTGEVLWKFKTSGSVQATPMIRDGKAYFGSFDENLYCISLPEAGSGGSASLVWNVTLHGQVLSSCHWYVDSVITADNSGRLYRVDASGNILWETDLSDLDIWASPLILEEEGRALIGDIGSRLWLVDLEEGDVVWEKTFEGSTELYSSGTYQNGVYYTPGGLDEKFYAVRVSDGEVLWSFDCGHAAYSTPVIRDDRIYFGSFEIMWCIPLEDPDGNGNISAEEVIWSSPTNDYQGGSSPLVVGGRVYIGSDDWNLYCFDSDTGEEIWTFETKGYIYSSPALYGERIYFGSSDRNIYCLGERPPGLVIEAVPDLREMTSDNTTRITITVSDDEGSPVGEADVTFTSSAGFIAFDEEGNTRLDHITDSEGRLIVYYIPVQVSSRSTIDINIRAEKTGLSSSTQLLQVIVEPGEGGGQSTNEVGEDVEKRVPYIAAIIILVMVNVILFLVVMVWFIRNRYEDREVGN
ncbi:MAG: PQQ-binding-like beta-propeller repeat protein [Thermoplasmatota archaeon]